MLWSNILCNTFKNKIMKFSIKNTLIILATTSFLASCSNDDNSQIASGNGEMELYFDNSVNGDDLILGASTYTNSNNETLKINRFNYIVSNFVLIKEDGTEVIYDKESSYFVISEEAALNTIHLEEIPAGNYTKIRFGLGVDQQRYLQGETAQQSFWDIADANNLTWTWSTGYKFINFEGTFTAPTLTGEKTFQVHQGSNTATDNYREITLTLPNTARVRTTESPSVHFIADANKILDGSTKIKLSEAMNPAGTSAAIMGGEKLISIASNTTSMFVVDHVHAGGAEH
jgi:hypothetical protein